MEETNTLDLRCPKCSQPLAVARYRCEDCNLTVDGRVEIPPLARLDMNEQAFVIAFIKVHGNIKRMGELFGISYPTVKSRLNAIGARLDAGFEAPPERNEILDRLDRGEIDVGEALKLLDKI
jgi:hypothetical protein